MNLRQHVLLEYRQHQGVRSDIYHNARIALIALLEGCRLWAYDDRTGRSIKAGERVNGCITIGFGFNMSRHHDQQSSRQEWQQAGLGRELFDLVYQGRIALTQREVEQLLHYSLSIRERELIRYCTTRYYLNWHELSPCVKLGIESIYYNQPKTALAALHYIARNQLDEAALEVAYLGMNTCVANRRIAEAVMMCGYNPLTTKVSQNPDIGAHR